MPGEPVDADSSGGGLCRPQWPTCSLRAQPWHEVTDTAEMASVTALQYWEEASGVSDHLSDAAIQRMLRVVREHLGLEIAFISQFVDGKRVFRYVDAEAGAVDLEVGGADPLEESYCSYVAAGSLPEFLADPKQHPVSAALPATAALGVGTHLSVPIRLSDGQVFGTFCCFGLRVRPDLEERDVQALRMVAALTGDYLDTLDADERAARQRLDQITALLDDPAALKMVFQPSSSSTAAK